MQPLLTVHVCRMRERTILVMPARMIVLLLIMSGDVEENPGPGMEGMVMWSMLEPQFSVLCIRTAGFSVQY